MLHGTAYSSEESAWTLVSKDLLAVLWWIAMWQRELEVLCEKLLDVWTADVVDLFNFNHLKDVNASESRSVTSGHILIHGVDSVCSAHFTVLLVHVVCARTRVVSNPYAKVLHLLWVLLVNLQLVSPE